MDGPILMLSGAIHGLELIGTEVIRRVTREVVKPAELRGAIIAALGLQPHPEGGYFAETYRTEEQVAAGALADHYSGTRPVSTAIYYLLTPDTFSEMHRMKSDEMIKALTRV